MPRSHIRRLLAGLAAALLLAGCAAQIAYREGAALLERDQPEAGLQKLREAVTREPGNVAYRQRYLHAREQVLFPLLQQADAAAQGNAAAAETLYRRALAIDPNNPRARAGLDALARAARHAGLIREGREALEQGDLSTARNRLAAVQAENPQHPDALALQRAIDARLAPSPLETGLAAAYRKPITIEFADASLRQVFDVIARTSGLNFLFDKEVRMDQRTSIYLKNSTIESAVYFTLLTNQLDMQVLDANTVLVFPNTPNKQKDYQEMVVKNFFLTNADAKSIANLLKTIVKSRDVVSDDKLNVVTVRDSADAIKLAEKLVAVYDVPEPEVMLEVEILEVKRSRLLDLGIEWPDSLTLTPLATGARGLTLRDLRTNIDSGALGASIGPVTVRASQEQGDSNLLANPRIRARNHEKARVLIGNRVPNITTTATSTGFVAESINYVDVGLKLEVEPTVHLDNDVAIRISLEVSNIVDQVKTQSGSLAYQIGTRTASTVLRLRDGENQVLAGLINDEERKSGNKIPGLGMLPVVGRLFGSALDDKQKTEIVLSITPRLIRNIQRPGAAQAAFLSGTDTMLRARPEALRSIDAAVQAGGTALPTSASVPANPAAPAGPPQLIWQGPGQVKAGDKFTVDLIVQSNQPVTALPLALRFDPKVLAVENVAEGGFLKSEGAQTSFTQGVDPAGTIQTMTMRSGGSGATGRASALSVSFRALASHDGTPVAVMTAAPVSLGGAPLAVGVPQPMQIKVSAP